MRRAICVLAASVTGALALPAAGQAQSLDLVGKSDLGGGGLNGEVAVVGNTAIVGSGILQGGGTRVGFYNGTYTCPATTIKIVNLANPSAPTFATIPMPKGVVANDVAALEVDTPTFKGKLAAVARVTCTPGTEGNFVDKGVFYYDVNDPANPRLLGRYDSDANRERPTDPECGGVVPAGGPGRCASSQDQVSLVQRPDGRVLSLSTQPFAFAGQPTPQTATSTRADLRVVDVTNPAAPVELGAYPNGEQRPLGFGGSVPAPNYGFSNNGCKAFDAGIGVGVVPGGNTALSAFLDQGLLTVDLTNPAAPSTLGQFSFGTAREVEGNANYVDFASASGRSLALVGESDWVGTRSSLRIDNGSVAGSKFACEPFFTLFDPEDTAQIYRKPGSQVPGEIAYVGRGCPGDVLLNNPSGKIAFRDRSPTNRQPTPTGAFCSVAQSVKNLQDAGAVGVVIGNTSNAAPQGLSFDGDPTGLTIPALSIDTNDATQVRDAVCPGTGPGCGTGGETLRSALVDSPGEWGALRVVDITNPAAPTLRGSYTPPGAKVFPPPDLGVYAVNHAIARGSTGFVAGNANGLRAIDLASANPTEIASFVPPDTPDPTRQIPGKAMVVGVGTAENGSIVISDVNSGLYVLKLTPAASPPPPPPSTPPTTPPGVTPKPPSPPSSVVRRRGRLSATVTKAVDLRAPFRFRTSGRLTLPSGIAKSVGCKGRVSVQVKRGTVTLSTRRVFLRKDCSYAVTVSFANARRFARVKRLRFTARFAGNPRVSPTTAPARFARVRR